MTELLGKIRIGWFFTLLVAHTLCAQVWIHVDHGEKAMYQPGDTLQLTVQMKTLHETCKDGMRQSKVFVRALEIVRQEDWVMQKPGFWVKHLHVRIEESSKSTARITVQRKVDKEWLFLQKEFPIQGN